MPENSLCEKVIEALLDDSLDPEQRRHLQQCPVCRQAAQAIAASAHLKSPPKKELGPLEKKVYRRIIASGLLPASEKKSWPFSWETLWPTVPALAFVLLLVVTLAWPNRPPRPSASPLQAPKTFTFSRGNGEGILQKPFSSEVRLAKEENATIQLSPDCSLMVSREAHLRVFPKQVVLFSGVLHAQITPGAGPFSVQTRDALVEVVGTVFSVSLDYQGTTVNVERGAVRVIAPTGIHIVTAGDRHFIQSEMSSDTGILVPPHSVETGGETLSR
jgi:hypothetical protein